MAYGSGLVHETLEAEFAAYVGTKHAIAVNTGGMAIQLTLRALGLRFGDEVIHPVDTCVANAYSVLSAGAVPILADVDAATSQLPPASVCTLLSGRSRVIMPVHMWGNPQDVAPLIKLAHEHNAVCVEDSCLSLGAEVDGKKVGSLADVGLFSFGCLKPLQIGEGGMIVTNDEGLAKELRSLRHYGDMTGEFGISDHTKLSWNGRMAEILAAVALEQLRGYARRLRIVRECVAEFAEFLKKIDGLSLSTGASASAKPSYTRVVLRIDREISKSTKNDYVCRFREQGIVVGDANFKPMTEFSFFRQDVWRDWVVSTDIPRIAANYRQEFTGAKTIYEHAAIAIDRQHFVSRRVVKDLMVRLTRALSELQEHRPH